MLKKAHRFFYYEIERVHMSIVILNEMKTIDLKAEDSTGRNRLGET